MQRADKSLIERATSPPPGTPPRSAPSSNGSDAPLWRQEALARARRGDLCPGCLGLAWVRSGNFALGHPRFGTLEPCPVCTKGRLSEYLRQASGLSGWMVDARFGGYLQTDARRAQYQAARRIAERGHGWLTLWGEYGQSKTFLLSAIVNHAIEHKRPAVYVTASRLLDHLRDAYKPGGLGFSEAFHHWADCQVLAIDEADAYHDTSWAQDKYRQLLDHRYNLAVGGESITLFACNPEPGGDGWPEALDWLHDRMRHFEIVQTQGGSLRPILREER